MAWTRLYDQDEPQRVNRWLAHNGVCSRREAETLRRARMEEQRRFLEDSERLAREREVAARSRDDAETSAARRVCEVMEQRRAVQRTQVSAEARRAAESAWNRSARFTTSAAGVSP